MEAVAQVVDGWSGPQYETEAGEIELPSSPLANNVSNVFNPGFRTTTHFIRTLIQLKTENNICQRDNRWLESNTYYI